MWILIFWILLFIGGYLIIFYAADVFIDNLKDLSVIYAISAFITGMLILGIDMEEMTASIVAAANSLPYIAVGNVIGNSVIALTLCFSLPALFYKFEFRRIPQFYFWIIYTSLIIIVIGFFIHLGLLITGCITLILFFVYLLRNFRHFRQTEAIELESEEFEEDGEETNGEEGKSKRKTILLIIISFLFILAGGELLIYSAGEIIGLTGLSESLFGFVIIAFVTNVEELTLIVKSIKRHSVEIGLGGMVGKIIWNMTFTFGISAIISIQIRVTPDLIWNSVLLMFSITFLNLVAKKQSLNRKDGLVLMGLFIGFLVVNFYLFSMSI
ncbi:MAG: sodium:calcium antiporter [Candidatus Helarchaeota archaeon]